MAPLKHPNLNCWWGPRIVSIADDATPALMASGAFSLRPAVDSIPNENLFKRLNSTRLLRRLCEATEKAGTWVFSAQGASTA